jgi:hypothetical protein
MRSTFLVSHKQLIGRLALVAVLALLVPFVSPVVAQVTIECPPDITVSNDPGVCSAVVDFPAPVVTDIGEGDTVTATPASGSTFPVGTNDVVWDVLEGTDEVASCTFTITVEDTEPPVITNAWVSKTLLWPPNHKMVKVTVYYQDSDNCDPSPDCTLTVTSNEPVNGRGDGNTKPDWQVLDAHHVLLRAERSGQGNGRTYTITITCTDQSGNSASVDVTVLVPHDRGKGDRGHHGNNGNGNGNGKGKGHGED